MPFIAGDEDGSLTAEIVSRLESSGLAQVVESGGDLRLEVNLVQTYSDQIGYRRDPQKIEQKIQKNLVASEERSTICARITLYDQTTNKIAIGPYSIEASSEYDFVDGDSARDLTFLNASGSTVQVLPFSLGQLEAVDSAREAAKKPLHRKLAKDIVDAVFGEQ